jgi:Cu(I)/Ag(I) efflux system membrane fusion protein
MNRLRWALLALLVVVAAITVGSYLTSRSRSGGARPSAQAGIIHYCPMHPTYTSDRMGECPICGMNLEVKPGSEPAAGGAGDHSDVPGLQSVTLGPERVQMIGVRTVVAGRRPLGGERELVGFVTPDESRLRRVQIRVSGWVQELAVERVGEPVTAGQPLLTLYSPELYQSEREFLIEFGALDSLDGEHGHEAGALPAARTRLRLMGVPEAELARLESTRQPASRLTLRSPAGGTVLERGVVAGQYVGPDTPLLTVADLSRVWVLADLYEQDLANVRAGDRVRFVSDARPGRAYEGRVDFVYPTVSTETRTVKARIVLGNDDGSLKPGMYGRVRVLGGGSAVLALPSEAVVDAGDERYVFLARAGGRFEPRRVRVGREEGEWVEILAGVAAGDTVVSSASFLIDSESRLEAAISGMGAQPGADHRPAPGRTP